MAAGKSTSEAIAAWNAGVAQLAQSVGQAAGATAGAVIGVAGAKNAAGEQPKRTESLKLSNILRDLLAEAEAAASHDKTGSAVSRSLKDME